MLHNKATEGQAKNDPVGFDLYDGIASVKVQFIKFCKRFEQRLRTLVPTHRIILVVEEDSTDINVSGFITAPSGKGKAKLGPLKVSLQFLEHHKMQYLELHRDLSKIEYAPQSEAALQNFKTLLLLEISLLMGCDVEWATGDGGEHTGAPVLPPAGEGDDGDATLDDSPVFKASGGGGGADAVPPLAGAAGSAPAAASSVGPAPAAAARRRARRRRRRSRRQRLLNMDSR